MKANVIKSQQAKTIIKKCHVCGQVHETETELKKCVKCNQSFLPLRYFDKVHGVEPEHYGELFAGPDELEEADLIIGLYVIW